jgi:hypothetical protein
MAMLATVNDITTSKVGLKVAVEVKGALAMSHKFLVSHSKTSNSCLWGVFISDPISGETQPNSGILAVSYGTPAVVNDGGTTAFCPVPGPGGTGPAGDAFPDDVVPGDELDIIGQSDSYIPSTCGMNPGESTVPGFQLSKVTMVTRTGTGKALPKPHVLTATELAAIADQTNMMAHTQWGGVKVSVANVTSVPQANGDGGTAITDQYGHIVLMTPSMQVGDKVYYQGLLAKKDVCHKGPVYANAATTFTQIDGFHYLDFCTWNLQPGNRCVDLQPGSDDCMGNMCP